MLVGQSVSFQFFYCIKNACTVWGIYGRQYVFLRDLYMFLTQPTLGSWSCLTRLLAAFLTLPLECSCLRRNYGPTCRSHYMSTLAWRWLQASCFNKTNWFFEHQTTLSHLELQLAFVSLHNQNVVYFCRFLGNSWKGFFIYLLVFFVLFLWMVVHDVRGLIVHSQLIYYLELLDYA